MPNNQILPDGYKSILSLRETEKAIKKVKDFFQIHLAEELNLQRVSAPRFVKKGTGINDDLNGVEKKVSFKIKYDNNSEAEVVFSLAKWKRMALADYGFKHGEGLYTDMDAIRPDEEVLDNLHSLYVDQWDWEMIISKEERSIRFLKEIVRKIYSVMKKTEAFVSENYHEIKPVLPSDIHFIHSEELERMYPELSPREREDAIAKEKKAVFVIGIGHPLKDGKPHDGRAPDYDDWVTETELGKGLNGDIIVWNPVLEKAFEISSMGIRVDKEAMLKQLEMTGFPERKKYEWHRKLLEGGLPLSVGGGIGQSRLCMFFLRKAHIGEVQSSMWPDDVVKTCKDNGISLL
ncbi:aspartate--ammonia ligase [Candidatus Woesearchaeota archaeon]|nr:aspartate--ammonia ligase [Candidatus Woesearchaeota archaeon]